MKNFVQPGVNVTVAAPAAVSSGDGVLVGTHLFGVAAGDAENGADVDLVTMGVFTLPKPETDEFAVGDAVYWNASEGEATDDDALGANPRVGVAIEAAANPSFSVVVRLDGAASYHVPEFAS